MALYQSSPVSVVAAPASNANDTTFTFEPSAEWSFVTEGDPLWSFDSGNLDAQHEAPPVIEALRQAVASGDLGVVREVITSQWADGREDMRGDKNLFATSLVEAIKLDNAPIAAYLLSEGIFMNISHFVLAAEMKHYAILQVFLDTGWNINTPIERTKPPPLS